MKKTILLFVAIAGLAMTSCKKDYTCECTTSSTVPGYTSSTMKATIKDVSKKTAKDVCNKTTSESTYSGVTYVTTQDCQIK